MYTDNHLQKCDEHIADSRRNAPTPVWHLARSAGVDVSTMTYHLGRVGIDVFHQGADRELHVSKDAVRKLLGMGVLPE